METSVGATSAEAILGAGTSKFAASAARGGSRTAPATTRSQQSISVEPPNYAIRTTQYVAVPEVVKRIWSRPDAIMLIFAGSAAEFAVNKAVHWLFWTNALPDEPIERFFETVRFAQAMVFGDEKARARAVAMTNAAHHGVEISRGDSIPQWAHQDVLFMLISYGERAHHVLYGPMSHEERVQHFQASAQIGRELRIKGLPETYEDYRAMRRAHLREHNERSRETDLLYASYRKHLGPARMPALLRLQASLVPVDVRRLLGLRESRWVTRLLMAYRYLPVTFLLRMLNPVLLPRKYVEQLAALGNASPPHGGNG